MRRRTLAILFGAGFGLAMLSIFFFIGGVAVIASAANSCYEYSGYSACDTGSTARGGVALLILGYIIILGGGILTLISWIGIMIKQAQRQQWAWFICTLLFSSIPMLLWLIIEPEVPSVRYVPVYPAQPGYPLAYPPTSYPPTSYPPPNQEPYYHDPYRP